MNSLFKRVRYGVSAANQISAIANPLKLSSLRQYRVALTHWCRHKIDAIFQTAFWNVIFFNEKVWIPLKISLKFVPKGPINNIPAMVQIMAWRRPGDKPLSEPMMISLLTHICVARLQWVNPNFKEPEEYIFSPSPPHWHIWCCGEFVMLQWPTWKQVWQINITWSSKDE